MPTTARGHRYPASTASPNVAQDLQNLATDINVDQNLGLWTTTVTNGSFNLSVSNTTFATATGLGPYSVTVPTGHQLEVEFMCPLIDVPATTGFQIRIAMSGTYEASGYWTNSNAASIGTGCTLRAYKAGTGASMSYQVEVVKNGTGTPVMNASLVTGGKILLRHRII